MTSGATIDVKERRVHHRVPLVCDVWQRCDNTGRFTMPAAALRPAGLAGRTLNLSNGGAMIQVTELPEGPARPQAGQEIELTLALPRSTADTFLLEHVRIVARVVRISSHCQDVPCTAFAVSFDQSVDLQLD